MYCWVTGELGARLCLPFVCLLSCLHSVSQTSFHHSHTRHHAITLFKFFKEILHLVFVFKGKVGYNSLPLTSQQTTEETVSVDLLDLPVEEA